jgi:low affinity Fe/Cu permease
MNTRASLGPEEAPSSPPAIERAVHAMTRWFGSTSAILLVLGVVCLWALSRPLFETIEAWQNAIITPLTILTFILIFLLQRSQNKALLAIHLKLNEIVASQHGASNRLIDLENMSEQEVLGLHRHYQKLASQAKNDASPGRFHTVEEAASKEVVSEETDRE